MSKNDLHLEDAKKRILDECRSFRRNDLDEPMAKSIVARIRKDFFYLDYVENEISHGRDAMPYWEWFREMNENRIKFVEETRQELVDVFEW